MTSDYVYFKDKIDLNERLKQSSHIKQKYPDRIPVIVEINKNAKDIPLIDKNKFLVPADIPLGQFIFIIRKRLTVKPEKAIFVYVNNKIESITTLMKELYEKHAEKDGFLYVTYASENTFG